jgi:hypothetical protein
MERDRHKIGTLPDIRCMTPQFVRWHQGLCYLLGASGVQFLCAPPFGVTIFVMMEREPNGKANFLLLIHYRL